VTLVGDRPDLFIPLNTAPIPAFIPVFTLNPITYRLSHTGLNTGMTLFHTATGVRFQLGAG